MRLPNFFNDTGARMEKLSYDALRETFCILQLVLKFFCLNYRDFQYDWLLCQPINSDRNIIYFLRVQLNVEYVTATELSARYFFNVSTDREIAAEGQKPLLVKPDGISQPAERIF